VRPAGLDARGIVPACGAPRTLVTEPMDQEKIAAGVPGALENHPQRDVSPWVIAIAIAAGLLVLLIFVVVNSGKDGFSQRSLDIRAAELAINDAGHPCGSVANAVRPPSGGIHAACSNGETYRIFTLQGKTVAMRCSAVRSLGIEGG
jgi:hypothetical protein